MSAIGYTEVVLDGKFLSAKTWAEWKSTYPDTKCVTLMIRHEFSSQVSQWYRSELRDVVFKNPTAYKPSSHILYCKYVARFTLLLVILNFRRIFSRCRLIVAVDTPLIWAISLLLSPFRIMLQTVISIGVR